MWPFKASSSTTLVKPGTTDGSNQSGEWDRNRGTASNGRFLIGKRRAGPLCAVGTPREASLHRIHSNALCASGDHEKALSLLEEFCDANPTDTDASLTLAVWQTWFPKTADYEATRRRLVHQALGMDQAGTAEQAAKAYCICSSADAAMLANALALAQSAVELGKDSRLLPWYRLGLGLAQYRNGHYDEALESLAQVEQPWAATIRISRGSLATSAP